MASELLPKTARFRLSAPRLPDFIASVTALGRELVFRRWPRREFFAPTRSFRRSDLPRCLMTEATLIHKSG
jgi:hypothetical protein